MNFYLIFLRIKITCGRNCSEKTNKGVEDKYPLFVAVFVMWLQDNDLPMKKWIKNTIIFVLVWSVFENCKGDIWQNS